MLSNSIFLPQPTKITRRSPSPSILSPSLPPRIRRVASDRVPWMDTGSGKHISHSLAQLTTGCIKKVYGFEMSAVLKCPTENSAQFVTILRYW